MILSEFGYNPSEVNNDVRALALSKANAQIGIPKVIDVLWDLLWHYEKDTVEYVNVLDDLQKMS